MTLGSLLSHMGLGTKQLTERFSPADYSGAVGHDPHPIYAYEPHETHVHIASKHHHGGGGHKSNAAMSALTLLAFLFFLHILQQCLRDHMMTMTQAPPIMIMTAGREGEEALPKKTYDKLDKSGATEEMYEKNSRNEVNENDMTKIVVTQHTPQLSSDSYRALMRNYGNQSFVHPGFVSAMDLK